MTVVALTGAGGFIGSHLLKQLLLCDDLIVRALHHNQVRDIPSVSDSLVHVRGDLCDMETARRLIMPGCVVVNLAYIGGVSHDRNIEALENLLEICAKTGIRRLIHCSTAVVAGRVNGDAITERTELNPMNEYERIKRKLEDIVQDRCKGVLESVILRPTAVFGENGKNLIKLMNDIRDGNRIINYVKSCIFHLRKMNLVYIDTVVSAIQFLIKTPLNIDGEVFIISDDEYSSNNYGEVERYLMNSMGYKYYPIPPFPLPMIFLGILLRIIGRTNVNPSCVYDSGKIISAGLKKTTTFDEGLSRFAKWYQNYRSNMDSARN